MADRKLFFVLRLYLLYLETSIPLTDTAHWTRNWTTGESSNKFFTENKDW